MVCRQDQDCVTLDAPQKRLVNSTFHGQAHIQIYPHIGQARVIPCCHNNFKFGIPQAFLCFFNTFCQTTKNTNFDIHVLSFSSKLAPHYPYTTNWWHGNQIILITPLWYTTGATVKYSQWVGSSHCAHLDPLIDQVSVYKAHSTSCWLQYSFPIRVLPDASSYPGPLKRKGPVVWG